MRVGHASRAQLTGSSRRRMYIHGGGRSRRLRASSFHSPPPGGSDFVHNLGQSSCPWFQESPKSAKNGAEVDRGIWEDARTHASSASHRASSCVTASTHPFEWIVGSPHESQSARAHHSSGFSKESVIPGDDGHENRPSGRPQSRTRAVVRARRGRDHPGSPRATRTMRPDARSGLISPTAPTAPIPPCPITALIRFFALFGRSGAIFGLWPGARRVFRPPEVRRTLRYVRLRPAIQQIRFFLALKSPRRRANMPWNMPRSAVW